MKKYSIMLLCVLFSLTMLNACSSHTEKRHSRHETHDVVRSADNYGTVTDIDIVESKGRASGGGAVLGAVVGGVIGHQLGSGRGNDVATGVGVVGGAVAGNQIEKNNRSGEEVYRVTVRFEDGDKRKYDYRDLNGLRVGDKVKVEDGQLYQR